MRFDSARLILCGLTPIGRRNEGREKKSSENRVADVVLVFLNLWKPSQLFICESRVVCSDHYRLRKSSAHTSTTQRFLPHSLSLLYKTILRPRLEYASIAWDNCSAADSRRLERLQLSVARAVMHQRRHPSMSKSQLLKQLRWPTLAWRRRRAKLIYFWKLMNNQGPPCLSSRIPKSVNNRCEYSLRNTGTVELPACSSSLYLSSSTLVVSSVELPTAWC